MIFDTFEPFVPPQFGIAIAREPWELRDARALRRLVFCQEQRLFVGDDRDAVDDSGDAITIVAVDYVMGMTNRVVGTVRIVQTAPDVWHGSRLAIAPAYRNAHGLGSGLIARAVTTAHSHGARTFFAYVQNSNVPLFSRLSWEALETCERFGRPHTLMAADVTAYPPASPGAEATVWHTRKAS